MSITEIQLKALMEFLTTPFGVLALAIGVLLVALSLTVRQTKWVVMAGMLFCSTLSFGDDPLLVRLMFPLEQLKGQGRGLTAALMGILLVGLLVSPRGWRRRYMVWGTFAFFVFELAMSGRMMAAGNFARGAVSVLLFLMIFVTLAVALPHALQQWGDAVTVVRTLVGFGGIFVLANVVQFLVNPSVVETNGRFRGTTGNAQHAAALLAALLLPMAYLITRPGRSRLSRLAVGAATSLTVIFLLWTGSRTGLLMAVVGIAVMFRARLGRLAIAGVIVGGMALAAMSIVFPDRDVVSEHLTSTQDTRSAVWRQLYEDFAANPMFGTIDRGEIGIRENSYLSILARFGIVGSAPFILALVLLGASVARLRVVRGRLADPMMGDLVMAGLVQIAVGSMFEGFLAGTLSPQILMTYCYLSLLSFLLEAAEAGPAPLYVEDVWDELAEHVEAERGLPASTW